MDYKSWIYALVLAVVAVIIYSVLILTEKERSLEAQHRNYVLGLVPSMYIFILFVLILGIAALVLYYWCISCDASSTSSSSLIAAYYLLTVIGIFLVTWLFFSPERPGFISFLGIALIFLGLILYVW